MNRIFQEYNPVRTRCWRLDRVLELIEARFFPRRPSRTQDDHYIHGYYCFLLRNRFTDWRRYDLAASGEHLALVQAHRLRWSLDAEDRAILEARILTRETDSEIAKRLGILPAAVDWYEGLFFTVRDRLDCAGWIDKTVSSMAGPPPLYGIEPLTEQQRHAAYRTFGYYGGPIMLDHTISAITPRLQPLRPENCAQWLDDAARAKVRQAAMMNHCKFNRTNVHLLFRMHLNLLKQQQDTGDDACNEFLANVEAMVKTLSCLESPRMVKKPGRCVRIVQE